MSHTPFDSQNAAYAQLLYEEFARNPESVPDEWRRFFEQGADAMRAAWRAMGLVPVPAGDDVTANTLSALRYPEGVDASLVGRVGSRGVIIAGGLYPTIRTEYFRVGHMGYAVTRPDMMQRTVEAVAGALSESGIRFDAGSLAQTTEALAGV